MASVGRNRVSEKASLSQGCEIRWRPFITSKKEKKECPPGFEKVGRAGRGYQEQTTLSEDRVSGRIDV